MGLSNESHAFCLPEEKIIMLNLYLKYAIKKN